MHEAILALDFDGVICNSRNEVLQVGLAAFATIRPQSPLLGRTGDSYAERFRDLIPLGNRAEDFGVALLAIEQDIVIADQAAYDDFFAEQEPAWLDRFHSCFYEERETLRSRNFQSWLDLHSQFRDFTEILQRRRDQTTLAIATSKDFTSVRALLGHFGLTDLFADKYIFDKDVGQSKIDHLRRLASIQARDFADITFVDDKVNHLRDVAELGVRVVLAGWGFNTQREHDEARARGYLVADLKNAEHLLFDY